MTPMRWRRLVNPILRRVLGLELCAICTAHGRVIGIGIRRSHFGPIDVKPAPTLLEVLAWLMDDGLEGLVGRVALLQGMLMGAGTPAQAQGAITAWLAGASEWIDGDGHEGEG